MNNIELKEYFETQEETYKKIEDEGVIMSIGDGIVKACGLRSVTSGEMVIMGAKGMILNLEHDRLGIVVGNDKGLKKGNFVIRSFYIMEIDSLESSQWSFNRYFLCIL